MRFLEVKKQRFREERNEQACFMEKAGKFLEKLRRETNHTLQNVSKELGVSVSYLSLVENGQKMPSDMFIRDIADFYKIDENVLFEKFGKVPLGVVEEISNNPTLQRTLTEIRYNSKLTEAQKQELYEDIYGLYMRLVEEQEQEEN